MATEVKRGRKLRSGTTLPDFTSTKSRQPDTATPEGQQPINEQTGRKAGVAVPTDPGNDPKLAPTSSLGPARRATTGGQGDNGADAIANDAVSGKEVRNEEDYPYPAGDPEPLTRPFTAAERDSHRNECREYTKTIMAALGKSRMRGDDFFVMFQKAFRPHTIRSWTMPVQLEWSELLRGRDVLVGKKGIRSALADDLVDVLYRTAHIAADGSHAGAEEAHPVSQPTQENHVEEGTGGSKEQQRMDSTRQNTARTEPTSSEGQKGNPPDADDDPSDDSDDDGDGKKNIIRREPKTHRHAERDESSCKTGGTDGSGKGIGLGQQGRDLVKALQHQRTFSGKYDDDLEEVLSVFEAVAESVEADEDQMRRAMVVILKGPALRFFSTEAKRLRSYAEVTTLMRQKYNSKEKQSRLLSEWQGLKLSTAMQDKPEESEMDVFRSFCERAVTLQNQLDTIYHGEQFLVDRLMEAIDLTEISMTLKDQPPSTSLQLSNRVANRLSDRPRTAGSVLANWAVGTRSKVLYADTNEPAEHVALYSAGHTYGGDARRQVRSFARRGGHHSRGRGSHNRGYPARRRNGQNSRPARKPKWLEGVVGCLVCGRSHLANEFHNRDVVTAAVQKLKAKAYGTEDTRLTSKEQAYVASLFGDGNTAAMYNEAADTDEDETQRDEDDDGGWTADIEDAQRGDSESDLAFVAESDLQELEGQLANAAFVYGLSTSNVSDINVMVWHTTEELTNFMGVKIDTGANLTSVMSAQQYDTYCKVFNVKRAMRPVGNRGIRGIGGKQPAIGTARIQIPFKLLGIVVDVDFLILSEDNIPSLLSMKDMLHNQLDISILDKTISCGGKTQPLSFENYFLVHHWSPRDFSFAMYTEGELRTIHRNFGHPSIRSTEALLKRAAGGLDIDTRTRESISQIARQCRICKREAAAPRRFKLTVGADDLRFNSSVQVDTMFIEGNPVVHMVDMGTHFCAASFVRSQTTAEIWRAMTNMWFLTYVGPPDFLNVDQGSNYVSKEMKGNALSMGVMLREAPIESPNTIGTVERYHGPLRAAYQKTRSSMSRETTNDDCLRMAVFAVNATIGPEGLCPMLLVFGTMPRPARTHLSETQIKRARVIDAAMNEVTKTQTAKRIAFALRHTHGPKGKEASQNLRNLPAGADVLVFRTQGRGWEGPHKFISLSGETVVVQMRTGRKIFRTTAVKPVQGSVLPQIAQADEAFTMTEATKDRKRPRKVGTGQTKGEDKGELIIRSGRKPLKDKAFEESRRKELTGLLENGTFVPRKRAEVPTGMRVYGSRFVDELRQAGERLRRKSRLIAQNYQDTAATEVPTKAPTVQRASQRLLLALAASLPGTTTFSRDVTQAYIQSSQPMLRRVFIAAPKEMGLEEGIVLEVVRPLYGIPESGLLWYLTYLQYHIETLGMQRSRADPCVFFKHSADANTLDGLVILQVDDSLAVGTKAFMQQEENASALFKSKPITVLGANAIKFNGSLIENKNSTITMTQSKKIEKLTPAQDAKQFASMRAAAQYIGVSTRPDIAAAVQLIAPGNRQTTKEEFKLLSRAITHLKNTSERGLQFVPLDLTSSRLILVTDASFANTTGFRSQLGFVLMLADKHNNANIVHYASQRCKRVTRSVLASEMHALIFGFDAAYWVRDMLQQILRRSIDIEAFIDSKTVFDVVAKDGATTEKRLQIDVHGIRESYENGELRKLGWIPGGHNVADALTKDVGTKLLHSPLWTLMNENKFDTTAIGWSQHTPKKKNAQLST